jgi:hypothetical protein
MKEQSKEERLKKTEVYKVKRREQEGEGNRRIKFGNRRNRKRPKRLDEGNSTNKI